MTAHSHNLIVAGTRIYENWKLLNAQERSIVSSYSECKRGKRSITWPNVIHTIFGNLLEMKKIVNIESWNENQEIKTDENGTWEQIYRGEKPNAYKVVWGCH